MSQQVDSVEAKLEALGLVLPGILKAPSGVALPFELVRVRGKTAYISGHGPQNVDGSVAEPLGKVGADLTLEQGYAAAKLTGLSILSSLKSKLGSLENITWLKALGMVNVAPGFNNTPAVINGFTDLILELYGPERGSHARSAVGMAALPFDIPVEIEAIIELD